MCAYLFHRKPQGVIGRMNLCMIGTVYRTYDGIVNTIWYLSPGIGEKGLMGNLVIASANCFGIYVAKEVLNFWKAI